MWQRLQVEVFTASARPERVWETSEVALSQVSLPIQSSVIDDMLIPQVTYAMHKKRRYIPDRVRLHQGGHVPVATSKRRCILCTRERRTRWRCSVCDVPLCFNVRRDCFKEFHMAEAKE
ncbi:hypothetical protein J6590_002314 [Homalodisca vitripennis]|nr:hypothetical protein J6590_002314 [Homalodisca vitripennis]